MPTWIASVLRTKALSRARGLGRAQFVSSRPTASCQTSPLYRNTFGRKASTAVSPPAITTPSNVPTQNKELYQALLELNNAAGEFVNRTRLQWVLRALSTHDPVVRIAVLSLDSRRHAQQLVRVLLADPLVAKSRWEDRLEGLTESNAAILLRYGEESEPSPPSPFVETLSIPSKILQKHNLEILITDLDRNRPQGAQGIEANDSEDVILAPFIQSPAATSNPGAILSYPVDKSLVIGSGIGSAVEFGRLTSSNASPRPELLKFAVSFTSPLVEADLRHSHELTPVNVGLASEAIQKFRQSSGNSELYEKGWFRSGLPALSEWLTQGLDRSRHELSATLKTQILSTVNRVETVVAKEATRQLKDSVELEKTRTSLTNQLQTWAEKSHTELRDQLDDAFAVGNWRRLGWWKLFWRVDDVAMLTSEILKQRWLVEAEKTSIYLAGCLSQSGAAGGNSAALEDTLSTSLNTGQGKETQAHETASADQGKEDGQKAVSFTQNQITKSTELNPWPRHISSTRDRLLNETVPPLHALAQHLVVSTLSTTGLTSVLGALIYIGVPGLGIFEAGAVASLGLVFSLRRMQNLWETARSAWEGEVREEGRKALRYTEETIKSDIESFGVGRSKESVRRKEKIMELVKRVRAALDK